MYYVNIYSTSQEYGGPEEGGWWYTHCSPVSSRPVGRKIRKARCEYRSAFVLHNKVVGRLGEILGGGDFAENGEDFEPNDMRGVETREHIEVYLEQKRARHTPRPYYE